MRFVTREDVVGLEVSNSALVDALKSAFNAIRSGDIVGRPKSSIIQPDGAFYIGTHATWRKQNLGIFHCIMAAPPATVKPGEVHYRTYQLLTDYKRGAPIALVDGSWTSTMLPAGVTAIGARAFARPDSRIATFIGAGLQSRVNLAALAERLPLQEVRVLGRSRANIDAFADDVRSSGMQVTVHVDAEAAIRGADVIVTAVSGGPGMQPFLDPAWVSPGAFVSAVDVGRSWRDGFDAFDRIVTDDREQAKVQHAQGGLRYAGAFDTELADVITGNRPPRELPDERIVMIHPGNIVGILGITALIHDRLQLNVRE